MMKKSELKSLIRECVDEVLFEGQHASLLKKFKGVDGKFVTFTSRDTDVLDAAYEKLKKFGKVIDRGSGARYPAREDEYFVPIKNLPQFKEVAKQFSGGKITRITKYSSFD
jgi:hypothetical protein